MRTKRRADAVDGINGDHFVDAVAEDETAIEHRHFCVDKRGPFAIQITRGLLPITGDVVRNSTTAFPPPQHDGIVRAAYQAAGVDPLQRDDRDVGDLPATGTDHHTTHRFAMLHRSDQRIGALDPRLQWFASQCAQLAGRHRDIHVVVDTDRYDAAFAFPDCRLASTSPRR